MIPFSDNSPIKSAKERFKSVQEYEEKLADLGFGPEEIKELHGIMSNIIDGILDDYLSKFYERT